MQDRWTVKKGEKHHNHRERLECKQMLDRSHYRVIELAMVSVGLKLYS